MFANKSPQMRKDIAEELCSFVSQEQFCELWEHATRERHSFLLVDYDNPDCMFKKNFDTRLILGNSINDSP